MTLIILIIKYYAQQARVVVGAVSPSQSSSQGRAAWVGELGARCMSTTTTTADAEDVWCLFPHHRDNHRLAVPHFVCLDKMNHYQQQSYFPLYMFFFFSLYVIFVSLYNICLFICYISHAFTHDVQCVSYLAARLLHHPWGAPPLLYIGTHLFRGKN